MTWLDLLIAPSPTGFLVPVPRVAPATFGAGAGGGAPPSSSGLDSPVRRFSSCFSVRVAPSRTRCRTRPRPLRGQALKPLSLVLAANLLLTGDGHVSSIQYRGVSPPCDLFYLLPILAHVVLRLADLVVHFAAGRELPARRVGGAVISPERRAAKQSERPLQQAQGIARLPVAAAAPAHTHTHATPARHKLYERPQTPKHASS